MKGAFPFAVLALALPTIAFATTIYTRGDFVSGTSSSPVATRPDFAVTAALVTTTLETGAFHLTPGAHVVPGSAPQALFLLMPAPSSAGNFADNMTFGVAKVPGDIPAEPRSLGLLGAGLIGLATVVRWKLRGTNTRAPKGTALPDEGQDTTRVPVGLETKARAASEVDDQVMPRAA